MIKSKVVAHRDFYCYLSVNHTMEILIKNNWRNFTPNQHIGNTANEKNPTSVEHRSKFAHVGWPLNDVRPIIENYSVLACLCDKIGLSSLFCGVLCAKPKASLTLCCSYIPRFTIFTASQIIPCRHSHTVLLTMLQMHLVTGNVCISNVYLCPILSCWFNYSVAQ